MPKTLRPIPIALVLLVTGLFGYWLFSTPKVKESKNEVLGETTLLPTETPLVTFIPTDASEFNVPTPPTTEEPTASTPPVTTSAPKPTPTVEPSMLFQTLAIGTPKVISASAGAVTTFDLENLSGNTLYKLDLSSYSGVSIIFSWPNTTNLLWSTETNVIKSQLNEVPIDDDALGVESVYYSGLLNFPETKTVYIYSTKSIPKLTLSIIKPVENDAVFKVLTTGVYNSNSGASYTSLPIKTRDEWGANPITWDSKSNANIDDPSRLTWFPVYYKAARIVIHHTVTPPTSDPATAVRLVYLYHTYTKDGGWGDIGYNYIIDQNGTIYQGKGGGDETQGYHAFGAANRISIGISLIGDFTNSPPTPSAQTALKKLLAEKAAFYGFALKYADGGSAKWKDKSYTVFGHRSTYRWNGSSWYAASTACPGNAFYPILPSLVQSANNYRMNNFTELKTLDYEVNKSMAVPHEIGTLVVRYKVPDSTPEAVIESYIPKYSGITSYTISGNTVTFKIESNVITHPNGDMETVIPPMNWTGYSGEYLTFTPPLILNGPEDRTKTLLKIFRLDPRVEAADLKHTFSVFE